MWSGLRVGLLGGSFNPAHGGHRHISLQALKLLDLDQVWWLVSPQSLLKPEAGMAPLVDRLARAQAITRHPRIQVTDLERQLGTRATADTLKALRQRFPNTRFVWLMGADNMIQIVKWWKWPQIFNSMPVAILARPSYSHGALASVAAQRFAKRRMERKKARRLVDQQPPAWIFLHTPLSAASATAIRASATAPAKPRPDTPHVTKVR